MLAQSLEDFRRNRYVTVEEFAAQLEISPSTYYRLLNGRSEVTTMRRVAERPGVAPAAIAEFVPPASPALMATISDAVDHAEAHGWIEVDPETLEPTGRRVVTPFPRDDDDAA
jgi:transcriptional regulator with XRE-family HTH domain